MTHERPYRSALSTRWALAELKRCSGAQFDPTVVKAFLESRLADLAGEHGPATSDSLLAAAPPEDSSIRV